MYLKAVDKSILSLCLLKCWLLVTSVHRGAEAVNQVNKGFLNTFCTYLADMGPAPRHIKLQTDSRKQRSPQLLNLKLFGLYQEHIRRGVCFRMTLTMMMSHKGLQETICADPKCRVLFIPGKLLSVVVAVTGNEFLKEEMRQGCLAGVAGIFLYRKQGRLMCIMKEMMFLIRLRTVPQLHKATVHALAAAGPSDSSPSRLWGRITQHFCGTCSWVAVSRPRDAAKPNRWLCALKQDCCGKPRAALGLALAHCQVLSPCLTAV